MKNIVTDNLDEIAYNEYSYDYEWAVGDNLRFPNSLIENLTKDPESVEIPTEYIDQIVKDWDYYEFNNYIEAVTQNVVDKVMEYIKFYHHEFMEDIKTANGERFVKQNMTTGQQISKNFNTGKWKKLNPSYKASKEIIKGYESNLLANLN